jgi:hypothetical protein
VAETQHKPLALVALCVREGLLDELLDAFCNSILEISRSELSRRYEADRTSLIVWAAEQIRRISEDVPLSVGSLHQALRSFALESSRLTGWRGEQIAEAQIDVELLIDSWLTLLCTENAVRAERLSSADIRWLCSVAAYESIVEGICPLISPVAALALAPFVPLDCSRFCAQTLYSLRRGGNIFLSVDVLLENLAAQSIVCELSFVQAFLDIHPDVVAATANETTYYALVGRLIERNPLLRSISGVLAFEVDRVGERRLTADVVRSVTEDGRFSIDWRLLHGKLKNYRFDEDGALEQGLPKPVHQWIVSFLFERQAVTSRADICNAAGFDIDLAPDRLSAGRIMAYAPGRAFLTKSRSLYVLREWVETESDRRGKIVRRRVVTPFIEKSASFEDALYQLAFALEPAFATYGLVSSFHMAEAIAVRLPTRPTELFYVTQIQEAMEQRLSETLMNIGRGCFVLPIHYIPRQTSQSLISWRYRQAAKLLSVEGPLRSSVLRLPEEIRLRFTRYLSIQ